MIGHNPKTSQNQSDDFRDIVALMKELPQVSAPKNFNASLQARLAAAKAEASEFADITSLIKELPRVAVPADFDFKLRARIAHAKAGQQKTSAGWLSELFGLSFSWTQAGMAMAVVAVAVSIVAFGILRSNNSVKPMDNPIAVVQPTQPNNVAPDSSAPQTRIPEIEPKQHEPRMVAVNNNPAGSPRGSRIQVNHTPAPSPLTPDVPETKEAGLMATKTIIIKHRSGEARVVNLSEYNLGLQTASLRTTPTSKPVDTTLATNIY